MVSIKFLFSIRMANLAVLISFLLLSFAGLKAQTNTDSANRESYLLKVTENLYKILNAQDLGEENLSEIYFFQTSISSDSVYYINANSGTPEYLKNAFDGACKFALKSISGKSFSQVTLTIPVIIFYKPKINEALNECFNLIQLDYLFSAKNNTSEGNHFSKPIIYIKPYNKSWRRFDKYYSSGE